MKKLNALAGSLIMLGAVAAAPAALACSTAAWTGVSPAVFANQPNESPSVARVSGLCGLMVEQASGAGFVWDNSPAADTTFNVRFYVLSEIVDGSTPTEIFGAYSEDDGAGTELLRMDIDNGELTVLADGNSTPFALPAGWNLVEVSWESAGNANLWINKDATADVPDATFAAGTGTVESAKLGVLVWGTDTGGKISFDDYESRRETQIGPIPFIGDGNLDDAWDVSDIVITRNEALGRALEPGKPDCTLDGVVDVADIVCVRNLALGR